MRAVIILLLLFAGSPIAGCSPRPARHAFSRIVMGTRANLVLYARDETIARDAATAAFARMDRVDAALSDFRHDSEAARLVAAPPGTPVPVSDDLLGATQLALSISRATDGAFDVTVGPIVHAWRDANGGEPDPASLVAARARSGWRHLLLDPVTRTITCSLEGMVLDFGGIGKGWAADRALEVLRAHGIHGAIVDVGGDLAVGAPPPGRTGWRIEIRTGAGHARAPLNLAECGVATSGDAERARTRDGTRRSHVIDPRTGRGAADAPPATVVAADAATADALASAVHVLASSGGEELVGTVPGTRVIIHLDDG